MITELPTEKLLNAGTAATAQSEGVEEREWLCNSLPELMVVTASEMQAKASPKTCLEWRTEGLVEEEDGEMPLLMLLAVQ